MITTQDIRYNRDYVLYCTTRLKRNTLDRIKTRSEKYGESVDEIVTRLLDQLEQFEKRGYAVSEDQKAT